jgi:hypothetical protein
MDIFPLIRFKRQLFTIHRYHFISDFQPGSLEEMLWVMPIIKISLNKLITTKDASDSQFLHTEAPPNLL